MQPISPMQTLISTAKQGHPIEPPQVAAILAGLDAMSVEERLPVVFEFLRQVSPLLNGDHFELQPGRTKPASESERLSHLLNDLESIERKKVISKSQVPQLDEPESEFIAYRDIERCFGLSENLLARVVNSTS